MYRFTKLPLHYYHLNLILLFMYSCVESNPDFNNEQSIAGEDGLTIAGEMTAGKTMAGEMTAGEMMAGETMVARLWLARHGWREHGGETWPAKY